jgi:CRISPR/Cas system type I-B associated protein Csh2 (Cas7 group RAMP superfamily)
MRNEKTTKDTSNNGTAKNGKKAYRKTAGRVKGPVQVGFAESLHRIVVSSCSITRQCVTNKKDAHKERTMGSKYRIPYALYRGNFYFSAGEAKKTFFSDNDLNRFEEGILNMFEDDRSAMRGEVNIREVFRITHASEYGNFPSHKLIERIKVSLNPGVTFPQSYSDYDVSVDMEGLIPSVTIERLEMIDGKVQVLPIDSNRKTLEGVNHKREYVVLIEVKNGNPNGDPDAGGRPRQDALTGKGYITDVCLKRKIRNYILRKYWEDVTDEKAKTGYDIFFKEGEVLDDLIGAPYETCQAVKDAFEKKKNGEKIDVESLAKKVLLEKYFDIRAFGAVLSTGDKEDEGSSEASSSGSE